MKKLLLVGEYIDLVGIDKGFDIISLDNIENYNSFDGVIAIRQSIHMICSILSIIPTSNTKLVIISESHKISLMKAIFSHSLVIDVKDPRINETIIKHFGSYQHEPSSNVFTEREEVFLSEFSCGITLKEMSESLGISERTVRRIKERLLKKTGLASSMQLVSFATYRSAAWCYKHGSNKRGILLKDIIEGAQDCDT